MEWASIKQPSGRCAPPLGWRRQSRRRLAYRFAPRSAQPLTHLSGNGLGDASYESDRGQANKLRSLGIRRSSARPNQRFRTDPRIRDSGLTPESLYNPLPMPLATGTRLGPHEILAPLGAGGMGEVYRARDTRLDRDVAIKVLPERLANDAHALARFEREAKAVAALSHPNILSIHDFETHQGIRYAVTELLDGATLREHLEGGAVTPRKAVEFALQIAHGLAAAHEKGIVHRDLKPENVFVTRDGHVKILDFGLAKGMEPAALAAETEAPTASGGTEPGTVLGTVGYMSPEQVRGRSVDPRSDIFSFGVLLYEMLAGRRAFRGDSAVETMNAILTGEPPELTGAEGAGAPAGLARIVRRCLEKDPAHRFQNARDLGFAIEAVSGLSTTEAPPPRASEAPAGKRSVAV